MSSLDKALRGGHYARKQIFSKSWLISWSHRSRYEVGLQLASQFAGKQILDYGCGDGSFLTMLMSRPECPSHAVGAEIHEELVKDCSLRLAGQTGLSFIHNDELDMPQHQGAYDAVICMEVLEHVLDVRPLLDRFALLLSPSGKLIISVPVETGLPLLVKQAVRRVAGWRGIGDYPGISPYSFRELWSGVVASAKRQHIIRPVHRNADGSGFHDHKGFNWMVLRETVVQTFEIEKILSSPLTLLTPHFASQVWFQLRKKQ